MRALLLPALTLVLACMAPCAHAKVYKCPAPGGGHEYRQIPCDNAGSGEVQINDPTVSKRTAAAVDPDAADASALVGDWCEFAVSATLDGEQVLDNIHWYFGSDYITYVHSLARNAVGANPPKYPLRREGQYFHVDDPLFGDDNAAWEVIGRRDGVIFVEGPYGGIMHMRPGRC